MSCKGPNPVPCSEWDRRSKPKRGTMTVALPATLLVVAVAAGGWGLYTQKQLQSLLRARQSPSDWLEESGARNQVPLA